MTEGIWRRFQRWAWPEAPASARQLRAPISTRRAYAEVGLVYLATFGLAIWSAILLLTDPSEALPSHVPTAGSQIELAAFSWAINAPGLLLALWLLRRRGWNLRRLGIRPTWSRGPGRTRQAATIGATMFVALFVAGFVLQQTSPGVSIPTGPTGAWGLIGGFSAAVLSGWFEELVVTAFVVTTLRQARRSWPEILMVSLALRTAYHVYYGTGWIVLWVAIWAGATFALYWRTRRLTALIVAHALWDCQGILLIELGGRGGTIVGVVWLAVVLSGLALLARRYLPTTPRRTAQVSVP